MIRLIALLILLSLPALAEVAEPAAQTLPGAPKCAVDLPPEHPAGGAWTDAEKYAWLRICLGELADMQLVHGHDGLPCKPTEIEEQEMAVPPSRVVRQEFLQLILTREPWVSAPVKPQVLIECARIDGRLDLENQHVTQELYIASSHLPDGADLLGAEFDRTLSFQGSVFGADLEAANLQVGGNVFLRGGAKFQELRLLGAHIGGDLDAVGSEFGGTFNANKSQVAASVYLRGGAKFGEVHLDATTIGGHLQLAGSEFAGRFDLSGAVIGELVLYRPGTMTEHKVRSDDPIWGETAELILRNTAVTALQSRPQSWRRDDNGWIEAELTGLTYDRLGGFRAGEDATLIDAKADILIDWIEKTRPTSMEGRYDPGPYEQLAAVLEKEGFSAKAAAVRFAKFERRSEAPPDATRWWSTWIFWPLSRVLLGYGVYPFTLLWWFAGLVGLGMIVAGRTQDARLDSLSERFWYSLENALPLVELKPVHKEIVHGPPWIEFFFHAQKLLGFLFATLLVGALSLLTE